LKKEVFHSSILDLEVDGQVSKVLLRDFQMHAFKPIVLHVDFQRVDANKKIHVKVPLRFINEDIAPVVKLSSGIINHVVTELDISCLPGDLPEFITVDLAGLEAGHSVHLSNITLPNGVTAVAHGDDITLVTGSIPAEVEVETGAPEAPEPAAGEKQKSDKAE
jgi:large subunit ribosomal protein L25